MSKEIKVAVYYRIARQDDFICAQQRARLLSKVESHPNWIVAGVFTDIGAVSVGSEFQRMLQQCRQGKIDQILTPTVSRFGRSMVDILACIRELRESGVAVIFEKENIHTLDADCDARLSIMETLIKAESTHITHNSAHMLPHHICARRSAQ